MYPDEALALAVLCAEPVLAHEGLQGGVGGAVHAAESAFGGQVARLGQRKQSPRLTVLHLARDEIS